MKLGRLVPFTLIGGIAAQSNGTTLTDALNSQNASLSSLIALLSSAPSVVQTLSTVSNVTILAPDNNALAAFVNSSSNAPITPDNLAALLSYHVLNGTYYASNFTNTSAFIHTSLTNQTFANVTDGQVVEGVLKNGNVTIFSGLGENSTVTSANVNFTGGTIHIIDRVLTIPGDDASTLIAANLTALAGALNQTNLAQNISSQKDLTIFAPDNGAFSGIGNLVANLTMMQLETILDYHVVQGNVLYSTSITNSTVQALNGADLHLSVIDGEMFVNSAKVVQANVLVDNGVVHVIDNVLNPLNSTATPNPTASTQGPAFSGASSVTGVPFTSGVPPATTTAPVATAAPSSPSSALAAPMKTGAVSLAALFGGAAVLANL